MVERIVEVPEIVQQEKIVDVPVTLYQDTVCACLVLWVAVPTISNLVLVHWAAAAARPLVCVGVLSLSCVCVCVCRVSI